MSSSAISLPGQKAASIPRVILGSALGTMIEWYDFYIFGSLATVLSFKFYPPGNDTFALIAYLATFAVGFLVRPFGALFFGRLGDLVGRRIAFIITLTIMGFSTASIGLLPTYHAGRLVLAHRADPDSHAARAGAGRRIRRRGGLCSRTCARQQARLLHQLHPDHGHAGTVHLAGGDCGHPAEHERRAAFQDWGWRLPFLLSIVLVVISLYIRLKMKESPIYSQIKAAGMTSTKPLTDAFTKWANLKLVLISLFGATAGQGVVWYTGQFYALFYLQNGAQAERQDGQHRRGDCAALWHAVLHGLRRAQ